MTSYKVTKKPSIVDSFLSLSRSSSILYENAQIKSKYSLIKRSRKNFLIRSEFGKLTIDLFFQIAREINADTLIECGANDASVSRRFLAMRANRNAIAIEANPFVHAKFKDDNSQDNLRYLLTGVSDKKKTLEFNIPKVTGESTSIFGSFQKLPQYYTDYSSFEVKVDKLDNIVKLKDLEDKTSIMWIDVEGEAFNLFLGAKKVLASGSIKMIYIEVQESLHYSKEKSALEISMLLSNYGFVPVARDFPLADLYNLLLIKEETLKEVVPSLNQYWARLAKIRLPIVEIRKPTQSLSFIKNMLLKVIPRFLLPLCHKLFARLGSNSSREIIIGRSS